MPIELRILSGARAGQSESFEKSVIAIGRHPMSDFRFDVKQDLDVSARHGEIRCVAGRYSLFDANSTNGTFVNGKRVPSGTAFELHDNDVIAFGAHGPTVSVVLPSDKRRATNDERRTTNDEPRTTGDGRRTTNDERRATSDERRATNDERRATSDDRRAVLCSTK
jgi:pSer/pThr/pTyr-binding forkhead associated (FHA) protein